MSQMSRKFLDTITIPAHEYEDGGGPAHPPQGHPPKIPGYYWDADAKRHFKLDTSCRHSHWHPDNIKRRNKEKALEEKRARLVARQVTKPPRFRRSHALAHPLMGGFLAREVYGPIGPATSSAGPQGFLLSDLETSGFLPSTLGAGDQSPPRGQGERGGGVIPSEAGGIRSMRIQTPVPRGKIALPSRSLIVGGMTTAGRIPGLDRDFQNAVLAENFRPKGEFNFCSGHSHDGLFSNIPCFWVSGYEERLGMGIVYATTDRTRVKSAYLPFDGMGRVDFKHDIRPARMRDCRLYEEQVRTPGISSIKYHGATHRVIMTSEGQETSCSVYLFNPALNQGDESGPLWLLGETDFYQRVAMQVDSHPLWWTNTSAIAPPSSSSLICALGTNSGIVTFDRKDKLCPIIPPHLTPGEILSLDFLPGHNDVIVAGCRRGQVVLADLRLPPEKFDYSAIVHSDIDWYGTTDSARSGTEDDTWLRTAGPPRKRSRGDRIRVMRSKFVPISHVVGMNSNQVLVSGIKHKMCIYDMRWRKISSSASFGSVSGKIGSGSGSSGSPARRSTENSAQPATPFTLGPQGVTGRTTAPIVTFPEYRNEICLRHGLAVSGALSSPRGMGQIIAVAQDHGTVGLFSARTGRRIPCPAVDKLRGTRDLPVQCLQWCRMPRETHESLWAGIGTQVLGVGVGRDDRWLKGGLTRMAPQDKEDGDDDDDDDDEDETWSSGDGSTRSSSSSSTSEYDEEQTGKHGPGREGGRRIAAGSGVGILDASMNINTTPDSDSSPNSDWGDSDCDCLNDG